MVVTGDEGNLNTVPKFCIAVRLSSFFTDMGVSWLFVLFLYFLLNEKVTKNPCLYSRFGRQEDKTMLPPALPNR